MGAKSLDVSAIEVLLQLSSFLFALYSAQSYISG